MDALISGLLTGGEAAVKSEQVSYRFEGATVLRKTHYYVSRRLYGEIRFFTFEEDGEFKLDKNQKTNDGGYNIDLDFKSLKGLPTNAQGVTAANAVKLCGIANWAQGVEKDVGPQSGDVTCYGTKVRDKYSMFIESMMEICILALQ